MTKKNSSKSVSDKKALKRVSKCWVRDPATHRMLFCPTDKRLKHHVPTKEAKKVGPSILDEAATDSISGNLKPTSKPDS